jgi:Lrp/AsnC family leucine-responsive transcriptional regulator|tara:strand:- start:1677 stop:2120 length:444 start_codon:yes stop_codon:yes gene_type:complete
MWNIMDAINKIIIKKLHDNSRMPISELSRQVHLSAPAVKERIQKLEEQGVITQYTVKTDAEKLGFAITGFVYADVFVGKEQAFIAALKGRSAVTDCFNVTGEKAFIFKICVKNMSQLDEILESISHVCKTDTSLVLNTAINSRLPDL